MIWRQLCGIAALLLYLNSQWSDSRAEGRYEKHRVRCFYQLDADQCLYLWARRELKCAGCFDAPSEGGKAEFHLTTSEALKRRQHDLAEWETERLAEISSANQ
ncbi:hypothetical protein U1Q18_044754 [Sarracenia purpurea var. burkii]